MGHVGQLFFLIPMLQPPMIDTLIMKKMMVIHCHDSGSDLSL